MRAHINDTITLMRCRLHNEGAAATNKIPPEKDHISQLRARGNNIWNVITVSRYVVDRGA